MLPSYCRKFSRQVRSGFGEVIPIKKSPNNARPSHSDTSSLALVVSALQSAQCPLGGQQGRVAPLAAGVDIKRTKMNTGSSSGNTKVGLYFGRQGIFYRAPPLLQTW